MISVHYGPEPDQVGDLYLPDARPAALVCLFHGGFWRMPYGRDQLTPMAEDLRRAGFAVWNLGYRRIGPGGTPFPATLTDVDLALACISTLRATYPRLHPTRVAFLGHSAGGHLAFWAAARAVSLGLQPAVAIGLAPLLDLVAAAKANAGDGAVQAFLGGTADEVPDHYARASPADRLPLGVQQWIFHGELDTAVPLGLSRRYVAKALAAGDTAELVVLHGADHMGVIDPTAVVFSRVRGLLLESV